MPNKYKNASNWWSGSLSSNTKTSTFAPITVHVASGKYRVGIVSRIGNNYSFSLWLPIAPPVRSAGARTLPASSGRYRTSARFTVPASGCAGSTGLDLDAPAAAGPHFRQLHAQHPVLVRGLGLVGLHLGPKRDGALEAPIGALHDLMVARTHFTLKALLPAHEQCIPDHTDIEIPLVE